MNIFETTVLCPKCKKEMQKEIIVKDNFEIKSLVCPKCKERWVDPEDKKEYEDFKKLKEKDFKVKLRMVGNSYAVSIPKEIIEYTEIRKEGRIVNMHVDGPQQVKISFSKITKKVYPKEE